MYKQFYVRCTQLVDDHELDGDDAIDRPAGNDGKFSYQDYEAPEGCETEEDAEEWFHGEIPIHTLEHFDVAARGFDELGMEITDWEEDPDEPE
jgi:hypothetical protein